MIPRFGDRVRISRTPETTASGFAGRVGEVWGESKGSGELSVFFEGTEEMAWFAPHLVQRLGRARASARFLPLVLAAALAVTATTVAAALLASPVRSLTLVSAATPCLPVQGYATSGSYPAVLGVSKGAARANVALRRAVVADQLSLAQSVKRHLVRRGGRIYETAIDPELVSASTTVVSALIPALKPYPGGAEGRTWIATTVEVRSGRTVGLAAILGRAPLALPRLVRAWESRLPGSTLGARMARDPAAYTPTLGHYRLFALTPAGLAFGFPQGPDGPRFTAIVPYRLVRPYLSRLGRRLVAGVRRPRPAPAQGRAGLEWAGLQPAPAAVARVWPLACA